MMDEATQLIRFAETAKGFDAIQKLKLILFAAGAKQSTYVVLKINPKNLEEKYHFEQHLQHNNIIYDVERSKTYEEIKTIKKNTFVWNINGTWHGYDIFQTKKQQNTFKKYKKLLTQQKHTAADKIAGKLYNYPACCIKEYSKEHDAHYLQKKYTYYEFYQRMHEQDRNFPFIVHYPCNPNCKATTNLNKKYAAIIKKHAPKFWKNYTNKQTFTADIIVDTESDIYDDNAHSLWPKKDGHEYAIITKKPINNHYYMLSYLNKITLLRGTIALATITMQYNYADVTLLSLKNLIHCLHHQRKFAVP